MTGRRIAQKRARIYLAIVRINAAILAVEILALSEPSLAEALDSARREGAEKVLSKNRAVEEKFNV